MRDVFVTGASGLVGSRLVPALLDQGSRVVVLQRRRGKAPDPRVRVVDGDLLEPSGYAATLEEVTTVVHLAAATGGATAEEHFRVNKEGTEVLLEQCRRSGVDDVVFVSTIAVKFADKRRYYYAQAKELAEEAVRASGLDWVIVRPTIVAAPGAPVLLGMRRLALLPVIPLFGAGRARVQPIWVDDLVDRMVAAIDAAPRRSTLEMGGPARVSMKDLLLAVRRACGRGGGRCLPVPLRPLRAVLGAAEAVGIRHLPVTAGQLASFQNDGLADEGEWAAPQVGPLMELDAMLAASLRE